jgi:hypothetical protein
MGEAQRKARRNRHQHVDQTWVCHYVDTRDCVRREGRGRRRTRKEGRKEVREEGQNALRELKASLDGKRGAPAVEGASSSQTLTGDTCQKSSGI